MSKDNENSGLLDFLNGEEKQTDKKKQQENIKTSMHWEGQKWTKPKQQEAEQLTLFEQANNFVKANHVDGIEETMLPKICGINYTKMELQILEGIARILTETNYKGSILLTKEDAEEWMPKSYPITKMSGYSHINVLPAIQIGQRELVRTFGFDDQDRRAVMKATLGLSTKPCYFKYKRLAVDSAGNPKTDKQGTLIMEDVEQVGTPIILRRVTNEKDRTEYYEIIPCLPMMDQIDTYFLNKPGDWRAEVDQLCGKNESVYTYKFIDWLMFCFEEIRRKNEVKKKPKNWKYRPYRLTKTWMEVADALKMPHSMSRRNKVKAQQIIQRAYDVAYQLGYLEHKVNGDLIILNEKHYVRPKHSTEKQ